MWPTFKENKPFAIALLALIITASAFFLVKIALAGEPAPFEHQLSFEGTGKAVGTPNVATVMVGMETKGSDVATVQKQNSERNNALLEKIKDLGVPEADIKTASYSVYPWNEWNGTDQKTVEKGWVVSQQLEVKIRDLTLVSKVLETAGQNGSNSISGPNFTIDDMSNIKAEAREKAIADAKAKAKTAAKSLGVKLGDVVGYWESANGPIPPMYAEFATRDMASSGPAPDIQTGTNEIQLTVTITYEIK